MATVGASASKKGLPIAAHLGLMLALAFVAAFVVSVAVIILLPPRPPDVMRGDQVIDRFAHGYEEASASRRTPHNDVLTWRIASAPTRSQPSPPAHMLQMQLAERLHLSPALVRIAAESARADMFVYQVRMIEHHVQLDNVEIIHDGANVRLVQHPPGESSIVITQEREPASPPPPAPLPRPPPPGGVTPPMPPQPPLFAPPPTGVVLVSGFEISARMPDGRWLVMNQGRNWAAITWIGSASLAVGAMLTTLSLLALLFARRLARPIQGFADAVEAVGVNPQSAPVVEQGPREMRSAARAVNTMQARLRALIADRTKTLATVAHDMRTPLMRLRLSAENVEPALREKMAKEIGEIEALVASFISFARDDPAEEARVRLDLAALLQSLVDDQAALGKSITFVGDQRFVITAQSLGLKRLFSNLIDNALKYGGATRVTLSQDGANAVVDVEDDGPGVPLAERESVFEPFVRLNSGVGGAGLGLPAARSIARAHGGDIAIVDSARGAHLRTTLPL